MTDYVAALEQFEGLTTWMYLDTRGLCTTGIGHMLSSPTAALALPWRDPGGELTSAEQVAAQWRQVHAAPVGHAAPFYRQYTVMRLSEDDARADAARVVELEALVGLRTLIPGFDDLPEPARLALVDLAYNLGVGRSSRRRGAWRESAPCRRGHAGLECQLTRGIEPRPLPVSASEQESNLRGIVSMTHPDRLARALLWVAALWLLVGAVAVYVSARWRR